MNLLEKKIRDENLFYGNVKNDNCWCKSQSKQQEIKDLVALSTYFLRGTFKTWNTRPNNVKKSKKIPTAIANDLILHYFHRTQFLSNLPGLSSMVSQLRMRSLFEQDFQNLLFFVVNFCSHRQNFPNAVILLVSLNI